MYAALHQVVLSTGDEHLCSGNIEATLVLRHCLGLHLVQLSTSLRLRQLQYMICTPDTLLER